MPENIWTEAQFPLDENHGITEQLGVTFPVLVDWSDPQESPTQAVARLNIEVVETEVMLRGAREDVAALESLSDTMHGFKIVSADQTADHYSGHYPDDRVRAVVHIRCGTVVGSLPAGDFSLGRMVDVARGHDCSAEALLYATKEGKFMAKRAMSLLDGADAASCSPEYVRALVEMVCDVAALSDRKDEVADFLWGTARTTGDRPAI